MPNKSNPSPRRLPFKPSLQPIIDDIGKMQLPHTLGEESKDILCRSKMFTLNNLHLISLLTQLGCIRAHTRPIQNEFLFMEWQLCEEERLFSEKDRCPSNEGRMRFEELVGINKA